MKSYISICLLVVLSSLFSCKVNSEFHNEGPSAKLGDQKMKDILYDIHFIEAMYNDAGLKGDSFQFESMDEYYSTIMNAHQVSEEEFEQTFEHYIAYPEKMESLLRSVSDSLHKAGNLDKK